ncbi:MAG: hypothetical protein K0R29_2960 [Pseudobdellovibrio sp.]|nr:hypothetical protein [Pseudobdellovibrio sp.]
MNNSESPQKSSPISSIKSQAIKKLKAVAKITAVVMPPASDSVHFDDQTEYEEKLNSVIESMPTLNTVSEPRADSDNQIHGLQADEMAEGHALAKLRKLSLENEKYISSTQKAYAGCAERSDLAAQSVRAVCFMRAMEISIKLNNPQLIVDLNVPADVRRLALQLVN